MKRVFIIILLFVNVSCFAQADKVVERMKRFHAALIKNDAALGSFIHDSLSYGHSNGWVENAKQFREDLGTIITYHSMTEDSITVSATKNLAHVRFITNIDATWKGTRTAFKLRVLEIWVRSKGKWLLFARQAVRYV